MDRYPVLDVDLRVIRENAEAMCRFCESRGIGVAGVVKFSDGDTAVAKAYHQGDCRQIASSRTVHLKQIKRELPEAQTMLVRSPMISEADEVVQWCDISLNSEETVLAALNEAAERTGRQHSVILMLDVGDRREGIVTADGLTALAVKVEREMKNLRLLGVGSSFACMSGVVPDADNLSELTECAGQVEKAIGRRLDIVSGGSSVTLTLLANDKPLPQRINHLRIGGAIANPLTIRRNRGVIIPGLSEDAFRLTAEVIEVAEKPSAPGGERRNWSGQILEYKDLGVRTRAIVALGSLDVGDPGQLIPAESGMTVIGGSSDHTVIDVTDCSRQLVPGDTVSFRLTYTPLLYCFATRHVTVRYQNAGA